MKKIILPILCILAVVIGVSAAQRIMKITYKDGQTQTVNVDDVDFISFEELKSPATVTVSDITLNSAKLTVMPNANAGKYTYGIIEKSKFDSFASVDAFYAAQLEQMKSDAASWDMSLADYLDFILYSDADGEQSSVYDTLKPGTEYYAFAYGMSPTDGTTTSALEKVAFSTQTLKNIDFKLQTSQLTAKTGIVSANPDSDDYYYLGFTTKEAFESVFQGSDEELRDNALAQVINNITMGGGTFETLARKGSSALSMSGLVPNTEYYAIAFGMEKKGDKSAFATTNLTKTAFSTPGFTVTDNCTFAITTENVQSILMDVKVVPSSATTRYYATIKADAEVFGKTPEQVADEQIVFEDGFSIDWATSKQVFTGERTLNSRSDLGVTNLKPETDYTVYVFGVDTKGYRTTDVATAKVKTATVETSSMTITFSQIETGSEPDSQDFFKTNYFVKFMPEPSVADEYYYVGIASKVDYDLATAFGAEEDFIKEVITEAGDNIMLNCFLGKPEQQLKAQVDYKGNDLQPNTDYYLIAFGYMGNATTPLFKTLVHTSE